MPVFNKHHKNAPFNAIYIGRGSMWGNPYVIGKHGTRSEVIEKHKQMLWDDVQAGRVSLEALASLKDKPLVCFCKPSPCHGDTLLKAAEWAAKQLESKVQTISGL